MGETLKLRGELVGHGGWVTAIATTGENQNMILTASRDKVRDIFLLIFLITYQFFLQTIIVWNLQKEESNYGYARRALRGHNHFVSDIVISSDGQFALSGITFKL